MKLLEQLQSDFPRFSFQPGERFAWIPQKQLIRYKQLASTDDRWSLLHELGHALLGHSSFQTDIGLLIMEVEAWDKAQTVARQYGTTIDPSHIEHCIDSYRDWLHARSTCPQCRTVSLQYDRHGYQCFNCLTIWHVSQSRLCRPHRRQVKQKQPSS